MRFTRIRVLATAVCVVLSTTAAAAGYTMSQGGSGATTVVAEFASAAPLVDGNEVKLDGVVVGKVVGMRTHGDHADVMLQLDPAAQPLHRDARFTIRPVSLLGERYVDMERGSPDAPLLDPGEPVPMSRTGSNVGLDQILNVLDRPTGEGLAFLITTLGEGLRGNGENADAAIRALAPALRDTQRFTGVLEDQNALLNVLVDRVQPVTTALAADDGGALDRLVGAADRLLAATSAQQRSLDATLTKLPGALHAARTTLARLAGTARQTTPTLRAMRPVTEQLSTISGELMRFSDALDPALATSKPVLRRAERLLDPGCGSRCTRPGRSSTSWPPTGPGSSTSSATGRWRPTATTGCRTTCGSTRSSTRRRSPARCPAGRRSPPRRSRARPHRRCPACPRFPSCCPSRIRTTSRATRPD